MPRSKSTQTKWTVFGHVAREARLDASRKVLEIALELRISPSFISDVERGVRRCPPGKLAKRWAVALGIDPSLFETAAEVDRRGGRLPGHPSLPVIQRLQALNVLAERHHGLKQAEVQQILDVFAPYEMGEGETD